MCGRYSRFAAADLIYRHLEIRDPQPEEPIRITLSWTVDYCKRWAEPQPLVVQTMPVTVD
jgi:hypothetical protein